MRGTKEIPRRLLRAMSYEEPWTGRRCSEAQSSEARPRNYLLFKTKSAQNTLNYLPRLWRDLETLENRSLPKCSEPACMLQKQTERRKTKEGTEYPKAGHPRNKEQIPGRPHLQARKQPEPRKGLRRTNRTPGP